MYKLGQLPQRKKGRKKKEKENTMKIYISILHTQKMLNKQQEKKSDELLLKIGDFPPLSSPSIQENIYYTKVQDICE